MQVTVKRLTDARASLDRLTTSAGATTTTSIMHDDDDIEYHLRVPAAKLDSVMSEIGSLGKVTRRVVAAEDVAEQIVDVEARVSAMRASRDRLRALMDRSASVADVVALERELSRVQSELDALESRQALSRRRVAMSDLTVRLRQEPVLDPVSLVLVGIGRVVKKLFVW